MAKAANRQFLIRIDGLSGGWDYWASKSGGEVTADSNKVYDGGSLIADVLASPPEVGDLTISRPYDPDRDQAIINMLIGQVGNWRTTISVTPTYGDLTTVRGVKGRVYSNALLIGVREPEPDASSGDAADYELTFAVGSAS
ncbi:MAG: hypothetical protein H7Y15_11290 [Pseudonocardia sp.]|nr:hypothetical protein [Pseudonocardia sp.]